MRRAQLTYDCARKVPFLESGISDHGRWIAVGNSHYHHSSGQPLKCIGGGIDPALSEVFSLGVSEVSVYENGGRVIIQSYRTAGNLFQLAICIASTLSTDSTSTVSTSESSVGLGGVHGVGAVRARRWSACGKTHTRWPKYACRSRTGSRQTVRHGSTPGHNLVVC